MLNFLIDQNIMSRAADVAVNSSTHLKKVKTYPTWFDLTRQTI